MQKHTQIFHVPKQINNLIFVSRYKKNIFLAWRKKPYID
jgi:hypothetical protein